MALGVDLAVNTLGVYMTVVRGELQRRVWRNGDGDVGPAGRTVVDGDGIVVIFHRQATLGNVDAVHACRDIAVVIPAMTVAAFDNYLLAIVGLHGDGAVVAGGHHHARPRAVARRHHYAAAVVLRASERAYGQHNARQGVSSFHRLFLF